MIAFDRRAFENFLAQYQSIREHQDTDALDADMAKLIHRFCAITWRKKRLNLAERNDFSEVERLFTLLQPAFYQTA